MRYVPHEYQEYAKEFIISHKVSALFWIADWEKR